MIYMVVKPTVVIDVKDLQLKMEKMTIISADYNFHTLSTKLKELQEEINAVKGDNFCKDDKLLTKLLCAAEATTNEAFALDIRTAKNPWITCKQTNKNAIINNLNVLYRNMVAEGSWKKTSTVDSKIIALTTQVAKSQEETWREQLEDWWQRQGSEESQEDWQERGRKELAVHQSRGHNQVPHDWCNLEVVP